jgi:DNA polymerase-3 subunit gamma/tau
MALIRLAYAADLPGPEEALKRLQAGESPAGPVGGGGPSPGGPGPARQGGGVSAVARQAVPAARPAEAAPKLQSFEDLLALIDQRRDITLKLDVERFIRPISFRPGAIAYEPAPGAPRDLAQRLVGRLKEWTGERWLIAAEGGGGAESLWEKQKREAREVRAEIEQHPFVQQVMQAFPGAEIVGVRHAAAPETAAEAEPPAEQDGDED